MSYYTQPFAPAYGSGVVVTPGAASAVQFIANNATAVEITNTGTVTCAVCFAETSSVTASLTTDYIILAGMKVVITKPRDWKYFAHIGTAAGSLHVIPGEGF